MADSSPQVLKNEAADRFEVAADGALATLTYYERGDHITLVHTEVPAALEGKGIGTMLARAAFDYAKNAGLRVIPACSFIRSFLERHPAYVPLTLRHTTDEPS